MPATGCTIAQLYATSPLILLCAALMAADGSVRRESLVFDSFESHRLEGWDVQPHSRMERVTDEKRSGVGALKWTFVANGKTRYGNLITKTIAQIDLSNYDQLALWFLSKSSLQGRVGFQLVTRTGIISLADLNLMATQGKWCEIRLDLGGSKVDEVVGFRLFCDGLAWEPGQHVFLIDDIRAEPFPVPEPPGERDYRDPLGPGFSQLTPQSQKRLRQMVAPPPLAERRNPYSTPMYYLTNKDYWYRGDLDHRERVYAKRAPKGEIGPDYGNWKLDRNRPEWQEAMVRDWAELGLTSTHLNVYPPSRGMALDADRRQALIDFQRISAKHGLKIGVRMDFPSSRHPESGAPAWRVHPLNPDNELAAYLSWVREVATIFKGTARYYVIGDEYNFHEKTPEVGGWNADVYVQVWTQVAKAIRAVDADVVLSMFGASSGNWPDVLQVLAHDDYRRLASAVAINYHSYKGVEKFVFDLDRLAPGMTLLSNGVGYCSSKDAEPRYPLYDSYTRYTDRDQAAVVAKNMFVWWELDAGVAPYYITLRNWVLRGKVYPRWFGFFGFEDYVIDEQDRLTIKRYPAWHAFQTIAHTFHDRPSFTRPCFIVIPTEQVSRAAAYVRNDRELVIILWQDFRRTVYTDVRIDSPRLKHAVQVNLLDHKKWSDVVYTVAPNGNVTLRDVKVGFEPVVLRLFAE